MKKAKLKYVGSELTFFITVLFLIVMSMATMGILTPLLLLYIVRHFIDNTEIEFESGE